MDQKIEQLIAFSIEDKYISAEMGLGLYEISGKLTGLSALNENEKEIFFAWYCLNRVNQHYQLTPLQIAEKFQPENFPVKFIPITDVIVKGDKSGEVQSKTSGLIFQSEIKIAPNQALAGLFLQENKRVFETAATKKAMLIQADQLSEQISPDNWPAKLFPDLFSEYDSYSQLVDLEDMIIKIFDALDIEDIDEADISDAIAEREHPLTVLERVRNSAKHFPDSAESLLINIFSALQKELDINPEEVKEPEKTETAVTEDPNIAMMEQMLGQFTDPIQKEFYRDFFQFIQEKGIDPKGKPQQQIAGDIGVLEKKWRNTPREALGGLTPDQYSEEHPEVKQSTGKTIKRSEPKVGRNDPCPCGSGKKYKKCCGKNL